MRIMLGALAGGFVGIGLLAAVEFATLAADERFPRLILVVAALATAGGLWSAR